MRTVTRWCLAVALVAAVACESDGNGGGGTDTVGGTDTGGGDETPPPALIEAEGCARLATPYTGPSGCPVADRVKRIALEVGTPADGIEAGPAFATRRGCDGDQAVVLVALANTSDEVQCFVRLDGLSFRSADGTEIAADDTAFVSGRLRATSETVFSATCLAPGDSGYAVEVSPDTYAAVARLVVAAIETTPKPDAAEPPFALRATGYDIDAAGDLLVDITNQGTEAGQLGSLSRYILLAADHTPLYATFVQPGVSRDDEWDGVLAPGASGRAFDSPYPLVGSFDALWISVDGGLPEGAADAPTPIAPARSAFASDDAWQAALEDHHDAVERHRAALWRTAIR